MTNYKFGESAVMPEGKPFRLSIEGVDTEYELVHRIDDAGRIHMAVDRADRRRPAMTMAMALRGERHCLTSSTISTTTAPMTNGASCAMAMRSECR